MTHTDPALDGPPGDTPEGHRIRSQTLWELAQRDYLRGETAAQVCDRYRLTVSTLRDRARKGEWRKSDQPDPDPVEDEIDDSPVDCEALADETLIQVRAALRRRRPAEAAAWMRVHDKLAAVVAGREERARRAARVDRAHGASAARNVMDEAALRLKTAAEIAENQLRFEEAHLNGELPWERFEELSALNLKAARALGASGGADPHPWHPDFSTEGRFARSDRDDLDDPDP